MVPGLKLFQEYFADFRECYVLIGGSACDVVLSSSPVKFRVTKDLDIVLYVEALHPDFIARFWKFVKAGGYSLCQKATGEKKFYRFQKPTTAGYPLMLELFSRHPDFQMADSSAHLIPIPAEEEVSSLSAILLDDVYYHFIHAQTIERDGLSVASPVALVVLKAKAWMELSTRKRGGGQVDSRDVAKHRKDIARLAVLIGNDNPELPAQIKADMKLFWQEFQNEAIDTIGLNLPITETQVREFVMRLCI